mmetsp:Transcript_69764/g.204587  ORF Transcript_69764/g.204587 Transcript_69764/m.204587 type:complete len:292 (+) Transcript_69764:560-1435(+)
MPLHALDLAAVVRVLVDALVVGDVPDLQRLVRGAAGQDAPVERAPVEAEHGPLVGLPRSSALARSVLLLLGTLRGLLFGAHREAGLHGVQVVQVPDLYGVVDGADHTEVPLALVGAAAEPLDAEGVGVQHDLVVDVHVHLLVVVDVHLHEAIVLLARHGDEHVVLVLDLVEVLRLVRLRVRVTVEIRVSLPGQLPVGVQHREELHASVVLFVVVVVHVELLEPGVGCGRGRRGLRALGREVFMGLLQLLVVLLGLTYLASPARDPAHGRHRRLVHCALIAKVPSPPEPKLA